MVFLSRASRRAPLGERFTDARVVRTGPRFTVWSAREPAAERLVTVKTPTEAGQRWLVDHLAHEAAILARVGRHPHIVELYDRATLPDGGPALVLQPDSGALEDMLHAERRITVQDAAALGIKLAGALESVHHAGFVHGNVRPRTVLLAESGEPMLTAFDEAVPIGATDTPAPLHITTPHTAPEVLEGALPTPASDVYGLASTLYELVAGRAAFHAYVGESPAAVIVRVLSNPVRPITAPDVPIELSDLLTWALSGDPSRRPPSPAWIAEELRRVQAQQGWVGTRMVVA